MFGYPTGRDVKAHGAVNLALHDQLAAFRWVRANIGAFGGDGSRVTAFGDSSGAMSIADLLLADQDVFDSAILMSGAPDSAYTPPAGAWDSEYDALLQKTKCGDWDCLANLDAGTLLNASQTDALIYTPVQDGELIRGNPSALVRRGRIAQIPTIAGNTHDEGTRLLPPSLTVDALRDFFGNSTGTAVPDDVWAKILAAYPANASYPTADFGNATSGADAGGAAGPAPGPEFPRVATIYADKVFHSRRRWLLQNSRDKDQVWSYRFDAGVPGVSPAIGSAHGFDVFYFFGWVGADPGATQEQRVLSFQVMSYW